MHKKWNHLAAGLSAALLSVSVLTGCGSRIIFTSGLGNDEVFTVGDEIAHRYEMKTYLLNLQRDYEAKFGKTVFLKPGNENVFPQLKENALSELSRVKALNIMAGTRGVTLDETEISAAQSAGISYFGSLSDKEIEYLELDAEKTANMYRQYALAQKTYEDIIGAQNTEISDEEARTVTVQCITVATYSVDSEGNRTEYTPEEKIQARQKAQEIVQEIRDGMDNNLGISYDEYIASKYEVGTRTYTVNMPETDPLIRESAYNAEIGTFGDPIETADGYRIIKGIAASDRQTMDETKAQMLAERQKTAWEQAWNAYTDTLDYRMVKDEYNRIDRVEDEELQTSSFFTTYEQYFEAYD